MVVLGGDWHCFALGSAEFRSADPGNSVWVSWKFENL